MPYVKQDKRIQLQKLSDMCNININCGDLNYIITKVLMQYLKAKGEKYSTYNDIVGVLECAKLEIYRRKIAKYEDTKIISNGDVYV